MRQDPCSRGDRETRTRGLVRQARRAGGLTILLALIACTLSAETRAQYRRSYVRVGVRSNHLHIGHSHIHSHSRSRVGLTSGIYGGIHRGYSLHRGHSSHRLSYRSPLSYTNLYSRIPITGYRVASPYYRRGPSTVSSYFSYLPLYRSGYYVPSFQRNYYRSGYYRYGYPVHYRSYPIYAPTYCPTFGYSSFGFSISGLSPTVLNPPVRITRGTTLASSLLASIPDRRAAPVTTVSAARLATPTERTPMLRSAGDSYFSAGRYLEAVASYTTAVESAPTESEILFRLGHALTAAGEYDSSARAFKAALSLAPELGRSRFRLGDFYGSAVADKERHLEQLAEYALSNSGDANAFFLVGLFLQYDGQSERATKFFERAVNLDDEAAFARQMLTAPIRLSSSRT